MDFVRLLSVSNNRLQRLWLKAYLDICGFCTKEEDLDSLNDNGHLAESTSNEFVIYIINEEESQTEIPNNSSTLKLFYKTDGYWTDKEWSKKYKGAAFSIDFLKNFVELVSDTLCSGDSWQIDAMSKIANCYNEDLFRSIYMLEDLYISHRVKYTKTDLLRSAAVNIQKFLEAEDIADSQNQMKYPRIVYACAFAASKVNECMTRLRMPNVFYADSILSVLDNKIGNVDYLQYAVWIRKAEIFGKEYPQSKELIRICENISRFFPAGYRYRGFFQIAEARYDIMLKQKKVDDDIMLKQYENCLADNPKHIRTLYKKALYYERFGKRKGDLSKIRQSVSEYSNLYNVIDQLGSNEYITVTEWEYGFKAKFREGLLSRELNHPQNAKKCFELCKSYINNLYSTRKNFWRNIYGVNGNPEEVILSKYSNTMTVIDTYLNELNQRLKELGVIEQ